MENTDDSYNIPSGRTCYTCVVDLVLQYKKDNAQQNKKDTTQQNDLNASTQKFPTMTLHNGQKKELCAACYKTHVSGIEIYQLKHAGWTYPKSIEE